MLIASYSSTIALPDLLGKYTQTIRKESMIYKKDDKFIVIANVNGVRVYADTFSDADAAHRVARSHV